MKKITDRIPEKYHSFFYNQVLSFVAGCGFLIAFLGGYIVDRSHPAYLPAIYLITLNNVSILMSLVLLHYLKIRPSFWAYMFNAAIGLMTFYGFFPFGLLPAAFFTFNVWINSLVVIGDTTETRNYRNIIIVASVIGVIYDTFATNARVLPPIGLFYASGFMTAFMTVVSIIGLVPRMDFQSIRNQLNFLLMGIMLIPLMTMVFPIQEHLIRTIRDAGEARLVELSTNLILLIALAAVAAAGNRIVRLFTKPILDLTQTAEKLHSRDLSARSNIHRLDEIGVLSQTLDETADQLQQTIEGLETRVQERTRDLDAASNVAREVTRVLDLDTLLPELVEQTKQGFNLYYASVFLYNDKTNELLLKAGTGDEGKRMKAEAKSFHITARPSLVAQVARERQAGVVNDTNLSDVHFFNPQLPRTQSEAAFPMVVGDELVGILDLQSETTNRFRESDAQIFSTLAEQIAIAVRNAQLYREQENVAHELARADLMKSQFLAGMSHELRTPLNAIINFVELVATGLIGPISEEQKELLEQSLNSSKHLLHLINDVLDISKIQAGKLTLFVEDDVNLHQEIEATLNMVGGMMKDKDIKLVMDIDDNLPVISGDKRRIRQVILNLLSNAIKFTEQGTVTLSAKMQGDRIAFAVIDTGPGISKPAQEVIFEPFVQTENGIKVEGTGLGLPISRSLAQAHGGDLWVESEPGEGAAFHFTLPMKGVGRS